MPSDPAKHVRPTKKPSRRRQADGAPTPNPCQLVRRPVHCRFERFQWIRASCKGIREANNTPSQPYDLDCFVPPGSDPGVLAMTGRLPCELGRFVPLAALGVLAMTGHALAHRAPFRTRTNVAQKAGLRQQFSRPVADGAAGPAPSGRRRRPGAMRTPTEAGAPPPLRSEEQGDWIRGTGDFLRRTGTFCVRTGSCRALPARRAYRSKRTRGPPADAAPDWEIRPIG